MQVISGIEDEEIQNKSLLLLLMGLIKLYNFSYRDCGDHHGAFYSGFIVLIHWYWWVFIFTGNHFKTNVEVEISNWRGEKQSRHVV